MRYWKKSVRLQKLRLKYLTDLVHIWHAQSVLSCQDNFNFFHTGSINYTRACMILVYLNILNNIMRTKWVTFYIIRDVRRFKKIHCLQKFLDEYQLNFRTHMTQINQVI